jgi:hypothetical protein
MRSAGLFATPIICAVLGVPLLRAGDLSSYRGIQLGANLPAAAQQANTNPVQARTVHQRPDVIQEMDWQPRQLLMAEQAEADPASKGLLCFLNGDLFRIVITYDRYKVEGMTAEDMIEGISATYGRATRPAVQIAYHSIYGEAAPVIARWQDSQYSADLVQTGDRRSFALVLYSKRLDALAQAAITEAVRLDAEEEPQRAMEQQQRHDLDERLALEKARTVNKLNFHP